MREFSIMSKWLNLPPENILSIYCEIALRWTVQDLSHDKSALIQVMAMFFAVRPQTITWANVDQDHCHDIVSLGHNELRRLYFYFFHIIWSVWPSK